MNPKEKNVTVEIYGPPVIDEKHGPVILDFKSEVIKKTSMPETVIHQGATHTPDGEPIEPGDTYVYREAKRGTTVQVYIRYLTLEGELLEVRKLYKHSYPSFTGIWYVNDNPVEEPTPGPTETPEESPGDQNNPESGDESS